MGGRGSGSNMISSRTGGRLSNLSPAEIASVRRTISKGSFEKVGNGQWEFNTDSRIGIGAQILDETGSTRDPMHGYGGKVYGVTTWGPGPDQVSPQRLFGSLNAAKTAAREEMKGWLEGIG